MVFPGEMVTSTEAMTFTDVSLTERAEFELATLITDSLLAS